MGRNLFPEINPPRGSSPTTGLRSFQPVLFASSPPVGNLKDSPGPSNPAQASPSYRPSIQSAQKSYGSIGHIKAASHFMESVELESFDTTSKAEQTTNIESTKAAEKKPISRRRTATAPVSTKAITDRPQTRSRKSSGSAAPVVKANARRASQTGFPSAQSVKKKPKNN